MWSLFSLVVTFSFLSPPQLQKKTKRPIFFFFHDLLPGPFFLLSVKSTSFRSNVKFSPFLQLSFTLLYSSLYSSRWPFPFLQPVSLRERLLFLSTSYCFSRYDPRSSASFSRPKFSLFAVSLIHHNQESVFDGRTRPPLFRLPSLFFFDNELLGSAFYTFFLHLQNTIALSSWLDFEHHPSSRLRRPFFFCARRILLFLLPSLQPVSIREFLDEPSPPPSLPIGIRDTSPFSGIRSIWS